MYLYIFRAAAAASGFRHQAVNLEACQWGGGGKLFARLFDSWKLLGFDDSLFSGSSSWAPDKQAKSFLNAVSITLSYSIITV